MINISFTYDGEEAHIFINGNDHTELLTANGGNLANADRSLVFGYGRWGNTNDDGFHNTMLTKGKIRSGTVTINVVFGIGFDLNSGGRIHLDTIKHK